MSEKKIKIHYTQVGDYMMPDLALPEQPEVHLGRYAEMRRTYLKDHHKGLYYNYLTSCTLTQHLADIQDRALKMEEFLISQMKEAEGVTEKLKADDMMEWVRRMNNIKNRARETVMEEVIYS